MSNRRSVMAARKSRRAAHQFGERLYAAIVKDVDVSIRHIIHRRDDGVVPNIK
jgi:hypothetical protein